MFNVIVSISKNKGIGINNKLPWKLNNDMVRFKNLTIGNNNNSIIMGYNTWKSINKILPNRHMYILSTTFKIDEVHNNYEVKSFDDINIVTTFVLTPLTYLGGTFYSIASLPQVWQDISVFNPIVYIISSYRLAFLGVEETSLVLSLSVIISLIIILFITALMLLSRGTGIKN